MRRRGEGRVMDTKGVGKRSWKLKTVNAAAPALSPARCSIYSSNIHRQTNWQTEMRNLYSGSI